LLGVTERTLRRWKHTVSEDGFSGLLDHRTRRPSPKRAPQRLRDQVKLLYKDLYWQWNVKHFHEQLHKHNIPYSYSWTKNLLQQNKLVTSKPKRSKHRKKRPRRPLVGMMLHIDGSDHCWIPHLTQQRQDLICVMDDANNYVYYAKLVPEENSLECMRALKHVVSTKGIFCSLYSDRASHFFVTPNSGKKVDLSNMTQIGRACYELGIQMIPAYSPQARGRSERLFGTWQGRLPQELELLQIRSVEEANQYICESFLPWHNQNLLQTPADEASAFCSYQGRDLDRIFSIKEARVVNHDNTVQYKKLLLQIEPCDFRISFAK
jgi:transposase